MTKAFNEDEPKPKENCETPIWDLVFKDMHDRDEKGKLQYGTRLQPFNGRDPLVDLYQELLDSVVYLRQALFEKYGE